MQSHLNFDKIVIYYTIHRLIPLSLYREAMA